MYNPAIISVSKDPTDTQLLENRLNTCLKCLKQLFHHPLLGLYKRRIWRRAGASQLKILIHSHTEEASSDHVALAEREGPTINSKIEDPKSRAAKIANHRGESVVVVVDAQNQ